MELIERINAIEGEVKLVKSEIKKVLIDLREAMNNLENPFAHIEAGGPGLSIGIGGMGGPPSGGVPDEDNAVPEPVPAPTPEPVPEPVAAPTPEPVPEPVLVPASVPKPEPMPEVKAEPEAMEEIVPGSEPEVTLDLASVPAKPEEKGLLQKIMMVTGGEAVEKIDIQILTQLMKWTEDALSIIGKSKLNEILDLYERTGKLSQELKDTIYRIEDLSEVNSMKEIEEVEMRDCIVAVDQLDKIITGETETPIPLMLSEEEEALE